MYVFYQVHSISIINAFSIFNHRSLPDLPTYWGTMSMDAYTIIVQVGEGTYGHVYKAKRRDSPSKLFLNEKHYN